MKTGARTPIVSFGPVRLVLTAVAIVALLAVEKYREWKANK